ncbi:TIR domain-containing adapter molecule 1-like isoform X2 [Nilaparvata lugens]|uniref:TIR domain-containing adapter molecule 1-like isoform X2 n=1 Tax=Nilaparvata lugens TaxID=108931 RepID=UPI00193CA420|nr:TIR domain-containing adapter molecule 1-like isoform X2 [Nilaparvata lugens]
MSNTQSFNSENRNSNTSLGSSEANSTSTSPMKTPSGTLKKDKKRRSTRSMSKVADRESTSSWSSLTSTVSTSTLTSNSQWYTQPESPSPPMFDCPPTLITPTTPIIELRQALTPERPLRSEVEKEKRMSRPTSGQFSPQKPSLAGVNGSGSNRDSIGTTDSTASEEDNTPPALPLKQRESDYCNIDDHSPSSPCTPSTPRVRNKPPPPEPVESDTPPTPPPKRPHLKSPVS